LVVTLDREDGSTQVVEVCLSPADWDDMTSIIGWHRESGALHVRDLVLKQPREYRLLIYRDYMLMPESSTGSGPEVGAHFRVCRDEHGPQERARLRAGARTPDR
jgi:hypothetical protein